MNSKCNQENEDNLKNIKVKFQSHGWNLAGSNVLTSACYYAKTHFLYVRPSLNIIDAFIAMIPSIACTIFTNQLWLGIVIGLLFGGFYLLWKSSQWKPVEQIIQTDLDRKLQHKLIDSLTNIFLSHKLDIENLELLVKKLNKENSFIGEQIHSSLIDFLSAYLKMQE